MATRVVYFAASSLDGRIAGPERDLAFLKLLTGAENDYETFFAGVDSLIMGAGSTVSATTACACATSATASRGRRRVTMRSRTCVEPTSPGRSPFTARARTREPQRTLCKPS